LQRVANRVVVFQFDDRAFSHYWLIRDYLPEFRALGRGRPSLLQRAHAIGARMESVPIPWDCKDGFFHAYWRRPEAYLDARVRAGTSVWSRVGAPVEARVVCALRADLESGRWETRNRELLALKEAELGARLLISG